MGPDTFSSSTGHFSSKEKPGSEKGRKAEFCWTRHEEANFEGVRDDSAYVFSSLHELTALMRPCTNAGLLSIALCAFAK